MSAGEHTPTPWVTDPHKNGMTCTIYDASGTQPIGNIDGDPLGLDAAERRAYREQNAAHIVLCVNSHDALVEALEKALVALGRLGVNVDPETYWTNSVDRAAGRIARGLVAFA